MANVKEKIKSLIYRKLPGNQPDFIIAGAQKAGTSSLHYYLSQHPKLVASRPKEVHFFDRDENFTKGRDWYHQAFKNHQKIIGDYRYFEATPSYMYRSYAAGRIQENYPKLKIIIILRDPVKRAFSAWNMYRDFMKSEGNLPAVFYSGYLKGTDNNILKELYGSKGFPSMEECIASELDKINSCSSLEEPSILRRGIYYPQVKKMIELFGNENVLILAFNDMVKDKKATLNAILTFLELPENTWEFLHSEKKNVRNYPVPLQENTLQFLQEFYSPHNDRLFDYLGRELNW